MGLLDSFLSKEEKPEPALCLFRGHNADKYPSGYFDLLEGRCKPDHLLADKNKMISFAYEVTTLFGHKLLIPHKGYYGPVAYQYYSNGILISWSQRYEGGAYVQQCAISVAPSPDSRVLFNKQGGHALTDGTWMKVWEDGELLENGPWILVIKRELFNLIKLYLRKIEELVPAKREKLKNLRRQRQEKQLLEEKQKAEEIKQRTINWSKQ